MAENTVKLSARVDDLEPAHPPQSPGDGEPVAPSGSEGFDEQGAEGVRLLGVEMDLGHGRVVAKFRRNEIPQCRDRCVAVAVEACGVEHVAPSFAEVGVFLRGEVAEADNDAGVTGSEVEDIAESRQGLGGYEVHFLSFSFGDFSVVGNLLDRFNKLDNFSFLKDFQLVISEAAF